MGYIVPLYTTVGYISTLGIIPYIMAVAVGKFTRNSHLSMIIMMIIRVPVMIIDDHH